MSTIDEPPTLSDAMRVLTTAAHRLGYRIESITLTRDDDLARIKLGVGNVAMSDDALDAITRRAKEAKDRGEPLT